MMAVDPRYFMWPNDRKALSALKAIPGFNALGKAFMKVFNEREFRILNMSSKLRVSEDQIPEVYSILPPTCEKLGIDIPELFIELDPAPNSYTYGDTNPFVVMTSGLLEYLSLDEVRAVVAHECGHIACHHTLYRTMGSLLLSGALSFINIPGLSEALSIAFSYWMRCSEFSADRAAAYAMGGSDPVVNYLIRFSGASKDLPYSINRDLFLQQADEYRSYVSDSKWNKVLEFILLSNMDHPLTTVRALEVQEWCNSDDFDALIHGRLPGPTGGPTLMTPPGITTGATCPKCGAAISPDSAFCPSCGAKLKKCIKCGHVLGEDDMFCPVCGTKQDAIPRPDDDSAQNAEETHCVNCGAVIAAGSVFCPFCGAKQN